MSYTFTQTGPEIQDILDRAEAGGQLDNDIAAKAPLVSPALTGDPTAPTQEEGDGSTKLATTEYADRAAASASAALLPTESATPSSIVSFPDGADSIPVKSFVGSIVPIQDLHGYEYPWPAGGGVNKIDADASYTAYKISDNTYQTTASNFYAIKIAVPNSLIGVECTFSAYLSPNASTSGFRAQAISGFDTFNGNTISGGTSGWSSVTFTPASGVTNLVTFTYGSGGGQTATVKDVQLEVGSARTDFAPYSNICPIIGWTGANIYRAGANLYDDSTTSVGSYINASGVVGTSSGNVFSLSDYIRIGGDKVTITNPGGWGSAPSVCFFDKDKNFISGTHPTTSPVTLTIPSGAAYLRTSLSTQTRASTQVELGSAASTFEPYTADTILLDFGQTVYAGTITALGGGKWSIQPTHAVVDMGSLTWTASTVGGVSVFVTANGVVPDANASNNTQQNTFCSVLAWHKNTQFEIGDNYVVIDGNKRIIVRASSIADVTALNSVLSGQTLVYELATLPDPIIVTAEELTTILGANTVWLDCGDVEELTYRADLALYIQRVVNGDISTLSTLSLSPSPALTLGGLGETLAPAAEPVALTEDAEPAVTDEDASTEDAEPEAAAEESAEAGALAQSDKEEASEA